MVASNAPVYTDIKPAEESSTKSTAYNYKYNLGITTGIYIPFDENLLERSLGFKFKLDIPSEIPQNIGVVATSQSDFYIGSGEDFWRTYLFYGAGEQFKHVKIFMNILAGVEFLDKNSRLSTKFETGLNTTADFQLEEKYSLGMYYTVTNLGQEVGLTLSREF